MSQEIGGNKKHSMTSRYIGVTASSSAIGRSNTDGGGSSDGGSSGGGIIYFSQPTYTHSETHLQNEGDWISLGTMVQLDTAVSSMCIDTFDEMVWLGHSNGRITSYTYPDGEKYSSFRAYDETMDVKQLLVQRDEVFSLSPNTFSIHSKGGILQWSFTHPDFRDQLLAFCALPTSFQKTSVPAFKSTTDPGFYQKIVLGGTLNSLFSVDINVGKLVDRVDTSQGICVLKNGGKYVLSGGINGELAMRDPRTLRAEHSFEVHTGSISDIEVKGDLIVTCGFANRYGEYYVDPVVKTFDLRSSRMLGQIHFPAGPAFLKFHPMFSSLLAIVSQTGFAQFRDIQSEIATTPSIEFSASNNTIYTIDTQGEGIECFDLSSSAEVMMFGDTGGNVHVFSLRSLQSDNQNLSRLNSNPIIRDEDPDAPDGLELLSNWSYSYQTLAGQYSPEIHPQILSNLKTITNSYSTATYGIALNPGLKNPQDGYLEHKTFMNYMTIDRKTSAKKHKDLNVIPRDYDFIKSTQRQRRFKEFDYSRFNKTKFIGLDNQLCHSQYCNAFIQVIYHLHRDLKTAIMNHTCERPLCLSCELGFLFYMFDQMSTSDDAEIIRITGANNFLRTLKLLSMEKKFPLEMSESSSLSAGERAILFNQLIWDHLHKELHLDIYSYSLSYPSTLSLPLKHPVMINLILPGLTFVKSNPFGHKKGTIPKAKSYRNRNIIDIVFGSIVAIMDNETSSYAGNSLPVFTHTLKVPSSMPNVTFADLISNALNKNIDQNSTQKVLVHLPNVLTFNFTMNQDDIQWLRTQHIRKSNFDSSDEHQRFKANSRVSIPSKFTVRLGDNQTNWRIENISYETTGATSGASTPPHSKYGNRKDGASMFKQADGDNYRSFVYSLRAVIMEVKHPYQQQTSDNQDHCVAYIRILNEKHEMEWYLFNDFTITQQESVFDFSQSWKTPCVLFYTREDLDKVLPKYVEFRNPIDPVKVYSSNFMAINERHVQKVPSYIPDRDEIVSIDTEFVLLRSEQTKNEKSRLDNDSLNEIALPDDQKAPPLFGLGRVSVILDGDYEIFIDDYIATPSETIQDYMTRFSGLREGDLDPEKSTHCVTHLKATYMKLRALVDRGVIFVGHGLQTDFAIINIYVPNSQIIDTVNLFQLPRQRKISLRFLANFLLHKDIQQETHSSVEDAETALQIYHLYLEYEEMEEFDQLLHDIYTVGRNTNWQIVELLPRKAESPKSDVTDNTVTTAANYKQ